MIRPLLSCFLLTVAPTIAAAQDPPAEFFGLCAVHDIHLQVEAAAFAQLEPTRSERPPGPPPDDRQRPPAGGRQPLLAPPPRPGTTQWEFPWVHARFECDGTVLADVGLRYKGNSSYNNSRNSAKRPWKIDFDRFVKGQQFHGLTQCNLSNNTLDPSQMREALACDVFRAAGLPAARTAFARVWLSVPGRREREYLGLYTVIEEVDSRFLVRHFGTKQGLLLKPELPPGLVYLGEDWDRYERAYEPKKPANATEQALLRTFLQRIETADDASFQRELPDQLDVEQMLDFVAVQSAMANLDSFLLIGHNFHLFAPTADPRFRFVPWDLNHAFGGFPMAGSDVDQAELTIDAPFLPENRLLARVWQTESWRLMYRQRLQRLLQGPFARERLLANIDAITKAIGDDVARDPTVGRQAFEAAVSGARQAAPTGTAAQGPAARPRGPSLPLRRWVELRTRSIADQLAGTATGKPVTFRPPGGERPRRRQ